MAMAVEIMLFVFLLASAYLALEVRDLLAAAVSTTVFSFVIAILFVSMGAVDVGFTEVVAGAGVVGVYYIVLILRTDRRTKD